MVIEVDAFRKKREEEKAEQELKLKVTNLRAICKKTFPEFFNEPRYDIWFGGNCYEAYLKNRRNGKRVNLQFPGSYGVNIYEHINLEVGFSEAYQDARKLAEELEKRTKLIVILNIGYDDPSRDNTPSISKKSKLEKLMRWLR